MNLHQIGSIVGMACKESPSPRPRGTIKAKFGTDHAKYVGMINFGNWLLLSFSSLLFCHAKLKSLLQMYLLMLILAKAEGNVIRQRRSWFLLILQSGLRKIANSSRCGLKQSRSAELASKQPFYATVTVARYFKREKSPSISGLTRSRSYR